MFAHTLADMPKHWTEQYIDHVTRETGLSLTALAVKAGISSTTLTRWKNSSEHPHDLSRATLEKIQTATGIEYAGFSRPDFVSSDGSVYEAKAFHRPAEISDDNERAMVNLYDVQASAGAGASVDAEDVVTQLSFPRTYLQKIANRSTPKDLAIISVKGDSMLPTISSGDVVMVDLAKKDWGYDGLFVIRDGDEALLIKRLSRSGKRGYITIISDNSRLYPPVEAPASDVEIVGKVLWMGVKV